MSQQLPLSPTSGSDASLDEIESLHVPPQPVKHDQRLEWTLVSRRSSEPMMSTTTHLATRHAPIHQSNATIVTQPGLRSSTESSEAEHYDSESSLSSTTSGPAVFLSAGLDTQRFSAKTQPPSQMDAHADRLTLPQDRAFDFTPSAYLTAPSSPILPASTPLDSSTATLPSLSPKRTRKNPTPQRSLPSASTETMRHQYGYSTEEDTSSVPFMWSPRVVKLAYFSPPPKMRRRKLGVRRVSPPQKSKSPTPTPFTLDSSGVGAASRRSTSRSSPAAPAAKRTRVSSPEESGQEIRPPPAPKKRSAAKPMPTGEGLDQAASSITWKGTFWQLRTSVNPSDVN